MTALADHLHEMLVHGPIIAQRVAEPRYFEAGFLAGHHIAPHRIAAARLGCLKLGNHRFAVHAASLRYQSGKLQIERMANPEPVLEDHGGVIVVRDDLIPGGTKARVLPAIMNGAAEYVYASPVCGYAQVALAIVARHMGKRATVFCAARKTRHRLTNEADRNGARIVEVPVGYMTVVRKRAQDYCHETGAELLPFGLDSPAFITALADVALALPIKPTEVWAVAGSGVLIRALQGAWPTAAFHAVRIGSKPDAGRAQVIEAPEKFENDARMPPPFPSCTNYDAKAWRFVRERAQPGALFWNVAA